MKRILYSCLLLLSLFLVKKSNAQPFAFTVTPITYCHDGTTPVPAQAAVTSSGVANSFSFNVLEPAGCPVPGSVVYDPLFPDGSVVSFTYWCCGQYTVTVDPYINGTPLLQDIKYPTFTCVNGATISSTATDLCPGQPATLTALPAGAFATYTWTYGTTTITNVNSIVVTPTANTCYSLTATTPGGCTVAATPTCINVQSTTVSISPASQTLCAGSTSTLYATASANTLGIQWAQPFPPPLLGTNLTQTIQIPLGTPPGVYEYTAGIVTIGPAGNCTAAATSSVYVATTIPMTLTPSSLSVCALQAFTLTANPVGATTYSFSRVNPNATPQFATVSNTFQMIGNGIYSVSAMYGACPGSAAVIVGTLGLTPTLTAGPTTLTCPGRTVDLTATGGSTYTFIYLGPPSATLGTNTSGLISHIAPAIPSIYDYSVNASGPGGCVGSTSISVHTATVFPRFSANSPASACPVTSFTLTEEGGTTYTLTGSTGVTSGSVTANTATASIPLTSFPATLTLQADSLGCSNTKDIIINKRTLNPTITASQPQVCTGSIFTLTTAFNSLVNNSASNFTYTAPTDVTVTPITANSATATSSINSPTLFPATFTVAVDSAGCEGLASITIQSLSLNTALTLTVSGPTQSVCPNSQFTLVANNTSTATGTSITNYTVSATAPIVYTPISPKGDTLSSTIPLGSFPGIYTVEAESGGCVGVETFTISRLFLTPTLAINPTGPICAGAPITLTASPSTTNVLAPMSYSFFSAPITNPNPITGALIQSGPTFTATDNPTVATIYAVIADSSGCTTSVPGTATIGISPPLTLTLTSTSPTVCSGTEATLSVVNVPTYTYTWFASTNPTFTLPTLPTTPADTAIVVNPTVTTTYTVHALTAGNCMGEATFVLTVNPTASLSISASASPTAICPGGSSTLSATGALSYTWIPSTSLNTINSPVVVSTPSATIIYTVIGDNTLGCYGAYTVPVNVVAYPSLTIVPTSSAVCTGYTSTLTAFGAVTYTWIGSSISPVYQQAIAVSPGTYSVIGSNGGACSDTISTEVLLAPDLTIQATASTPSGTTCIANNSPKYSKPVVLNASGGSNYTWAPYNPSTMTYSIGPQTTVIPPASTCYTVTGYTSVCSGYTTVCVTVIPQFTMNVVPPLPAMCTGDSLRLRIVNISTLAVGPISAFSYSWTEPSNAVLSLNNPLSSTVIAFPQSTSTYSVEMRDSRSCVSIPRLVTVTVYPRPLTAVSIPTINGVPTNTICYVGNQPGEEGNLLTLTALNQNTGLPFGVVPTYTWLPPAEYVNTSILTPPNNNNVTVNAPVRTPSVVVYSVISGYNGIPGCSRLDTVSVRVIDCRPITSDKIKFKADRVDTICTRECITYTSLTDTAAGGPQKLFWTFAGGAPATSTLQFPTICYNLPNDPNNPGYNVTLRVENPYPTSKGGSSQIAGVRNYVTVVDAPNVSIVAPGGVASDTTVRFGQSVSLNGSGALSYNWAPFYNISSSTNPNVVVHPFQTTQYILTGYNSKNCFSSDTVNVIIIPDCGEMYVPNAFSPNDDKNNDVLYVRGICLESLTFMVFNRWGEKVFETIDQKIGWNGLYRGEEANSGVYVYRLEGKTYDGKAYSSKGNITLIR